MAIQFTLRAKLIAAMVVSIAILLTVSIAGLVNNEHLANVALDVAEVRLPRVDLVIEADRDMQQAVVAERSLLFIPAGTPRFNDLQKVHEENIGQAIQRASKFATLAKNSTADPEVEEFKKRHALWADASRRVVKLAATDHDAAVELSFGDADAKFESARELLDKLTEKELVKAQELAKQGEEVVETSRYMIMSLAGFGLLISLLIAIAFPRLVVRPINLLTARLIDMASGEGDLTVRLDARRRDELGKLAMAFNSFVEKIQDLIREVSGSTSQVASAAEELQVVATDASDYIQKQSLETDQVATAVTEMTATIQEVARNADQAAVSAREVDTQAGEGRKMVSETIERIDRLAAAVERAGEVIHRLEEDSQNIGTVLDVIRGIAEQTNLLALNAAIEAARAGEQGRGFAVVADEVRTLAGRTQKSTSEIQEMIERLQSAANEAVAAMKTGQEEAEATVGQAAKTSESLDAVTRAVSAISEMNQQIATAAEEQSAVSSEIDKNVSNISHIGEQTAESARQTASSGTQLAQLAEQLQMLVGRFRI